MAGLQVQIPFLLGVVSHRFEVSALVFGLRWTVAQAGPVALFAVAVSAAFGAALGL